MLSLNWLEPLAQLFKDEVRASGLELGLPAEMVLPSAVPGTGTWRNRIIGASTPDRLEARAVKLMRSSRRDCEGRTG